MSAGKEHEAYEFGRNWDRFVRRHLSDERIETSRQHLLSVLERPDLAGLTFLDVGCGSGIHSLAAVRSGARRVVSFDVDPDSVATARRVHAWAGAPANWEVLEGSVLDPDFVDGLDDADVVYSWGVLHHTGDLWTAVRNAASKVLPGGLFYIAIYERDEHSDHWIAVKRRYNRAGWWRRRRMEVSYVWNTFARGKNLGGLYASFRYITTYSTQRGMAFMTDVRDWLGGWPYEPATPDEVVDFCRERHGLEPVRVVRGGANAEYVLARAEPPHMESDSVDESPA